MRGDGIHVDFIFIMAVVGFEHTPPERLEPFSPTIATSQQNALTLKLSHTKIKTEVLARPDYLLSMGECTYLKMYNGVSLIAITMT